MSTVTLDESVASQLIECKGLTTLRDPQGRVIGTFAPASVRIYDEGETSELDIAELNRRAARGDGIPSSIVREVLLSLR